MRVQRLPIVASKRGLAVRRSNHHFISPLLTLAPMSSATPSPAFWIRLFASSRSSQRRFARWVAGPEAFQIVARINGAAVPLPTDAGDRRRGQTSRRRTQQGARGRIAGDGVGLFADAQLTAALIGFQQQYPQVEIVLPGVQGGRSGGDRMDLAVRITNALDPAMIARPLALCRSRAVCLTGLHTTKWRAGQCQKTSASSLLLSRVWDRAVSLQAWSGDR